MLRGVNVFSLFYTAYTWATLRHKCRSQNTLAQKLRSPRLGAAPASGAGAAGLHEVGPAVLSSARSPVGEWSLQPPGRPLRGSGSLSPTPYLGIIAACSERGSPFPQGSL